MFPSRYWFVSSYPYDGLFVRKHDHKEITINNKQDENIKSHYNKDTDITWFTQDGLHPHKNFQSFIIIPSNKMKGYNLHQPCCTSSSQSLSHNHIDQFYNATIQYTVVLQCLPFIKGIPWEKPRASQNHGPVNHPLLTKSWLWNYNILKGIFS